jgi:hypothetical protein
MNSEKLTTPIGDFEFVLDGYPTKETAQKRFDALDFQRACQAYLDFIPAMSMYSLLEGQENGFGCRDCSDLAVAADLLDATPYVLTGNTESVYFAGNVDRKKDGPRKPNIINISGLSANTTHPNDFQYFVNLDKMIQYEPTEAFNTEQLGLLRALGIEKGRQFNPDERMMILSGLGS